jgi:hypothetical protein
MNEQEIRETLKDYTEEQLRELAVQLLLNEQEMRKELDEKNGIIR